MEEAQRICLMKTFSSEFKLILLPLIHNIKYFESDTKNICTAILIIMFLVSMGLMLNKTEEEIDKLREEQFNFQSD
jgi:hypothetical protein